MEIGVLRSDLNSFVIAVCGMSQLFLFILLAIGSSRSSNLALARRWKVSIIIGVVTGLVCWLLVAAVALFAWVQEAQLTSLNAVLVWGQFTVAMATAPDAGFGYLCLIMPLVFVATFGSYMSFVQTGDAMINHYWKDSRGNSRARCVVSSANTLGKWAAQPPRAGDSAFALSRFG